MKPFNLEAANRGDALVTRDGRAVTEFKFFETCKNEFPCVAIIDGHMPTYTTDGKEYSCTEDSKLDLFMAPKIVTKYLNVYHTPTLGYAGNQATVFDAKHDAEENADRNTFKVLMRAMPIEVEIE